MLGGFVRGLWLECGKNKECGWELGVGEKFGIGFSVREFIKNV